MAIYIVDYELVNVYKATGCHGFRSSLGPVANAKISSPGSNGSGRRHSGIWGGDGGFNGSTLQDGAPVG